MDYLRNLGSAAVSTLVQKSGLTLPFVIGSKVTSLGGVCNLYDGTRREDGTDVSIFEYDFGDSAARKLAPVAKNALRKLRTTRHPDVLKFMDAVESDTTIHIMTERVRPLSSAVKGWSAKGEKGREDWLLWGIHRISVALAFINEDCASTHGNLRPSSIFISPSGEWKLGGFELLSSPKDESAVLYTLGGVLPDALAWASPEVKKSGWSALKNEPPAAGDAYALGLLLHSVFNQTQTPPPTAQPPHPPPQLSSRGALPAGLFHVFKQLLNPNPKARMSVKAFLDTGMGSVAGDSAPFFANNQLVKVCMGLDNFNLAGEADKATLLRTLKDYASLFPPEFSSFKILPSLAHALEFGGASAAAVVPFILQLGSNVSPEDYQSVILAPLVKLFASPDRGTRMAILEHLPEFADKLDKKTVVDKIWPHIQTGFSDTVPIIRESTVKSIILLSSKLNDRILNNDLLRHLARMQMDTESSIRTNTCILIGRLGPSLGYNTKRKVLVPAFTRALKDPFVHARVAGLMAFMATTDCFEMEELATKVIPNISPLTVDKEKLVRDQAFKAMGLFVKKLDVYTATLPETAIFEGNSSSNGMPAIPGQDTLANTATGAAGVIAGWAISSLSKTLASPDMQNVMGAAGIARPTSAPNLETSALEASSKTTLTSYSTLSSPSHAGRTSGFGTAPASKGMQLGSSKVSASVASTALATRIAEEAAVELARGNPWGSDDLMDVNADEDDWSGFESAPPVVEPKPVPSAGLGIANLTLQNGANRGEDPRQDSATSGQVADQRTSAQTLTPPIVPRRGETGNKSNSPLPGQRPTPGSSPVPSEQEAPSTAGLTKEEKAAEMARRKEERKQRIAQLKEQKKNASLKPPNV